MAQYCIKYLVLHERLSGFLTMKIYKHDKRLFRRYILRSFPPIHTVITYLYYEVHEELIFR